MESQTIISIEEARKKMRKFDIPSELLEEAQIVDIINRLDSVARLYVIGIRESSEHLAEPRSDAPALD